MMRLRLRLKQAGSAGEVLGFIGFRGRGFRGEVWGLGFRGLGSRV